MSNLEKIAYKFAQYSRSCAKQNVAEAIANGSVKIATAQWEQLASIVSASIDEAYSQVFPELLATVKSSDSIDSETFEIPDDMITYAGKFASMTKRPFAAFTIVRNEPFFLELWCQYYGRAFGEENLYVLDNSTSDGSIDLVLKRFPRINVVSVPSTEAMRWAWCTSIVKCFQRMCFRGHEVVIFSDADEYLIPNDGRGLLDFAQRFRSSNQNYVRATGWGVVHQIDQELALTSCEGVLNERRRAWRSPAYDKTLISKIPLDWAKGSHTIKVAGQKLTDDPRDSSLALVHLRELDFKLFHKRAIDLAALNPDGLPLAQHGSTNIEQIKQYFRTRVPSWKTGPLDYVDEPIDVPVNWKTSIENRKVA